MAQLLQKKIPWPTFLQALVITAAVLWIYWPALHGGWLWDDRELISENDLIRDPAGLWKIWFAPGGQIDYYPVKSSIQWLQWHLWGLDTLGYHLTNIVLHILSALLVWRLLGKFKLRLAWLGGLIFAVHPVQVESVAWIAEFKNTLSLPLLLLAMCAWIDFEERAKSKDYWLALGLFFVAMLCKLSVVLFPLVILLYAWWRRGRIGWNDLKARAPFFVVSLLLGLITIASGIYAVRFNQPDPGVMPVGGLLARLLAAGLSLSFCFSKSFLPVELLPIYPKWPIDPSSPVQYLPWLVLGGVICWLWTKRRSWGRHALLGLGFFLINLAPCPGFIPAPDMAFTWVMDHFLYLPIIGLIGLTVAALGRIEIQLPAPFRFYGIGLVSVALALMTFASHGYAALYLNSETLWTYEIRHDPGTYLAYNNLGFSLEQAGRLSEATDQYEQALRLKPNYAVAHYNLGLALQHAGRSSEAMDQFGQALRIDPNDSGAHYNLGIALQQAGRVPEATEQFAQAVRIKPDYAEAHNNLGLVLFQAGRIPEAAGQFALALQIKPGNAEFHNNLGLALLQTGQGPNAIAQFQQALQLRPDYADACFNLANALLESARIPEAIDYYEQTLQLKPDYAEAHNNLGAALLQAGRLSEAVAQFQLALQIKPDYPGARNNLARVQTLQKTAPPQK
jgi:tetratricopeptide (TPR) repeat protein